MAKLFQQPAEFDFSSPNKWEDWRDRFYRFRLANKLNKETGEVQISSLIYSMGIEAENIFKSFNLSADDSKNFDTVIESFNNHFIPKKNVIHERAKFHQRQQQKGETTESFIRSLYELADNCNFGTDKNERIRDTIVVGLRDKMLSTKMQLHEDLTLDKAVTMARQSEMVKSQVRDQVGTSASDDIDEVRGARAKRHQGRQITPSYHNDRRNYRQPSFTRKPQQQDPSLCTKCNRNHGKYCPATGKVCRRCKKKNHFEICCKTSQVREIIDNQDSDSDSEKSYFLNSIEQEISEPWNINLNICKSNVSFKIDTGADVTTMSEPTYKLLKKRPPLSKSKSVLKSPGGQVDCKGYFIAETYMKGQKYLFRIYVIGGKDQSNLLSRGTATSMKLIQRIDEIPKGIFSHTGLIDCEPVKIKLKPDAIPYCVTTARRIPFPLLPKVEKELNSMIDDGIIEKVNEPSDWCAPIVPVVKPSGAIRICVDLKKLNESVKREFFMLPNIDDISPNLAGMSVFSKLDASKGYFQLPLNEESSKLTTFITPFGRYAFKRVPFGVSSASEIFQKKMNDILKGLKGVNAIQDDVIIYGRNVEEHDSNLQNVITRIEQAGLKLNKDKCVFRQSQLEYFGHVISDKGISPNPKKVQAVKDLQAPTNQKELQRVIGLINYLGRYVSNLSTIMSPMTDLLKAETAWFWGPDQTTAFENVKSLLTKAPVLAYYDQTKPIVVSADASRVGLGWSSFSCKTVRSSSPSHSVRERSLKPRKNGRVSNLKR